MIFSSPPRAARALAPRALILPHQGGGGFFEELDTPQLCCGVLHYLKCSRTLPAAPEPAATVREHGGRMRGE